MNWSAIADFLAAVLLICGCFLTLAAGVGVLRFPDLLARMHAATKPQVLGLILMLTAEALRVRSWSVVGILALIITFQLLTAPIAAHIVGRAGYRTGQMERELTLVDELAEDQTTATVQVRSAVENIPDFETRLRDRVIDRARQVPNIGTSDVPAESIKRIAPGDPDSPQA